MEKTTWIVTSHDPFTVEYKRGNRTKLVKYAVPLTHSEIYQNAELITFDEETSVIIQFENIPSTGFEVRERKASYEHIKVNRFDCGIIKLSSFSLMQLLEGAGLLDILDTTLSESSPIPMSLFKIFVKLNKIFRDSWITHTEPAELELSYTELKFMLDMLKSRMAHCEMERDQRSKKFNPDTYIGQKFLLLELYQLMYQFE